MIIGGNWKSNGTRSSMKTLVEGTLNHMKFDQSRVEVVVAPIMLHLAGAGAMLSSPSIQLAAQTLSTVAGNGAFTGEVSAEQLQDSGVGWVIIGHSERRA